MANLELLDLAGVSRYLKLSPSSIRRERLRDNTFPQPICVGTKYIFVQQEIHDWAAARVSARPQRPLTVGCDVEANVQHSAR